MSRSISEAMQAEAFWENRDLDSLLELYRAHRDTTDPSLLYFAGLGFSATNNQQKAIECWRRAIEHRSGFEAPLRALAYEMLDKQILIDAVHLFERLDALNKATPDDLTALAEVYIKQGFLHQAYNCLTRALEQDPMSVLGLLGMATIYACVGAKELALKYLKKLARTRNYDLSELTSSPEFESLWKAREFKKLALQNGKS